MAAQQTLVSNAQSRLPVHVLGRQTAAPAGHSRLSASAAALRRLPVPDTARRLGPLPGAVQARRRVLGPGLHVSGAVAQAVGPRVAKPRRADARDRPVRRVERVHGDGARERVRAAADHQHRPRRCEPALALRHGDAVYRTAVREPGAGALLLPAFGADPVARGGGRVHREDKGRLVAPVGLECCFFVLFALARGGGTARGGGCCCGRVGECEFLAESEGVTGLSKDVIFCLINLCVFGFMKVRNVKNTHFVQINSMFIINKTYNKKILKINMKML